MTVIDYVFFTGFVLEFSAHLDERADHCKFSVNEEGLRLKVKVIMR